MIYEYGYYINEHRNQTLDTGKVIFPHIGKLDIQPMDEVIIDGKKMVVSYYKATVAVYGTPNTYNYEVELVSHTIKLQRILLPNRSITQPFEGGKKSIWDIISQYLELYAPDYDVLQTDELQAFTEGIDAPEMAWNNPTLFEVLNDLLSVVKSVVTMPDSVTISYIKRDEIGSAIPEASYYNIEYSQSTEQYAHTLQSELKNVNVDYVNYRSQRITPRTIGSPVLNTDNVSLILEKPIGLVTKVVLSTVITEQVDKVEGVPVYDDIRYDVDITSHVVPKQVYDLAYVSNTTGPVTGNYKRDLLYYNVGGTTIDGLAYNETTWFAWITAPSAIENIFYNETSGKSLGILSDFWDDISFYVEYITAEDVKFNTDRDITVKHDSMMPNAQTTSYVDLLGFSKYNKQLVNSMANDTAIIYGRVDTFDDVPALGDYIDDYLLSQRTIVYEDGYVEYTAELQKNHFAAISYTGINAERRYTSIASASDALLSHHLNKLDFLITKEEFTSTMPLLEYLWSIGAENMQIGLVTFDTDVQDAYGIIGSIHYTVDSVLYSIRMEDNYNVAISQEDVGVKVNQSYTPYVDSEGEFTSFVAKFYIGEQNTDMASDDRTIYLAALDKARALPKLLFTPDGNDLIYETDILYRYKDNREITAETWQFTVKGDEGIYVTDKFFRDSAFFNNPKTLKVLYSTTHTYDRFSTVAVGTDASATITVVGNKLSVTSAVTGATSWALTNVIGDTYIMVNGDICDLYMKALDGKTYLSGAASATLTLIGSASGWKSTDYVGEASGILTLIGSATGYKSTDFIGSASGLLTLVGQAIDYKSTDYVGSASGVLTLTGSAIGSMNQTSFTVTFKDWNGTTLKSQTTSYGGSVTPPTNPSRVGYTFTGWSGDYTGVIQDEVVVATYTANTYTVYFNENGGGAVADKTVTFGSTYGTLPTPSQSGWTFLGWYTSTAYTTQVTSGTVVTTANNHTLYAHWARYYWSSGGSSPVGGNSCSSSNDVGNIVCDTGIISCSWNPIGIPYTSTTDESDNVSASCYDAAYKTECVLTTPPSYGWVAGGSALTPSQLCSTANHVGNVRGEVVSCSWGSIIDTYFSTINESTSNPNCYTHSTRTVCTNVGGNWLCEVSLADRTYGNFETCTLVSQAEYTCTDYEAVQEFGYVSCSKCEVTYK
jgi:uncharacterized repeat protein (TIGR02543 family)